MPDLGSRAERDMMEAGDWMSWYSAEKQARLAAEQRAQEAERNLELGTKEMGFMVNTIERLRLNASVMAVEARDECLRLSSGQLEAAEKSNSGLLDAIERLNETIARIEKERDDFRDLAGRDMADELLALRAEHLEAEDRVIAAGIAERMRQTLQEIEGYLSAEMGDGQLPPRVKDRIDKAYAAARVALGKNPSP